MSKYLHKNREAGFTLIELMIVILIIAILVAIAIPVYLAAQSNAQKRTCQANLRTIAGAVNTYFSEAEVYPDSQGNMVSATYNVLKAVKVCPKTKSDYTMTGGGTAPSVFTCAEGGHTI